VRSIIDLGCLEVAYYNETHELPACPPTQNQKPTRTNLEQTARIASFCHQIFVVKNILNVDYSYNKQQYQQESIAFSHQLRVRLRTSYTCVTTTTDPQNKMSASGGSLVVGLSVPQSQRKYG
jgi:hypothetical protein